MGSSHPPTPIGWRVNGVGIQSNTILSYYQVFPDVGIQSNTVLSYYQVFPDNRADIQGWIRVVWRVDWGLGWGVMILWRSQPLQSQTAFLRSIAEIAQPG